MKKYAVRLYYDTYTYHEIEANSEEEALEKAKEEEIDFSEVAENMDLAYNDYDIWEVGNGDD